MDSLITLKCPDGDFLIGKKQLMATSKSFENQLTEFPNTDIIETKYKVEEWENLFDIINSSLSGKHVPLKIKPERYIEMISYYDLYNETFFRSKLDSRTMFTELTPHTYFFHMIRENNGSGCEASWKSDEFSSYSGILQLDEMPGLCHKIDLTLEELKDRIKSCKVECQPRVYYWNITVPGEWYQVFYLCPSKELLKKVFSNDISGQFTRDKWVDQVKNPEKYEEM